ncbi:MAG: hypothetical protein BGP12_07335 [Rhodospirillales bacterium 70-18]|nr:right-handed parallel beta-helix repeat-containing protein [Rhodospirillales bacterium]OJY71562.1 MAG: hypothetical protein BGP12_07335 [Rhodospirillales bacterium 70-18]
MSEPRYAARLRALALAALVLCAGVASAQARVLEAGEGKAYKLPSQAIAAAQDGDTVQIAPGTYYDCAVVRASHLLIEGTGPDGSAILTDKTCMGKALLVIGGGDVTVRNMTLQRARVNDNNGAGIRAEGVNLTIDKVKFINNQNGILAGDKPGSKIIIRDSEFLRNGVCMASCAHGIYVGHIALLRVEHSHFAETKQGHHIKSRAQRTEVIGCTIEDGDTGTASYLIEAPNGGALIVRDNTLQKGPKAENHSAAIMIGSEGVDQPTPEILIENNKLSNTGNYGTYLVVNRSATEARLKGNKLTGSVKPLLGDGTVN